MLVLALDTSTSQSSIALCSEEQVYGEYTWYSSNNHSVELLGNLRRMLADCQYTLSQIDAVAVATGPGSFNGVRVGVATAKSFSFSLRKPLVGVSTLDICAAQQQQWHGPVCAVQEAGRSDLYAACYLFNEQQGEEGEVIYTMKRLGDYLLLPPDGLSSSLQEQSDNWFGAQGEGRLAPLLFCGEISEVSRQKLHTFLRERCAFAGRVQSTRKASTLAMLAIQRLRSGLEDDPLTLEPLYLRRPSITTSTRKRPLLGGAGQSSTGHTTTEREQGALRH
jgi:tRNA threonylcarbamoyladenosine biosynthesis protein TsaB